MVLLPELQDAQVVPCLVRGCSNSGSDPIPHSLSLRKTVDLVPSLSLSCLLPQFLLGTEIFAYGKSILPRDFKFTSHPFMVAGILLQWTDLNFAIMTQGLPIKTDVTYIALLLLNTMIFVFYSSCSTFVIEKSTNIPSCHLATLG